MFINSKWSFMHTQWADKHPLCKSFCPKQIFQSSFSKRSQSWAIMVHIHVPVQLSILPAASQHIGLSELHLLPGNIIILSVAQKSAGKQKVMRRDSQMYNLLFRHLPRSSTKNCSPIPTYKVCSLVVAQGQQAERLGLRAMSPQPSLLLTAFPHHPPFPWVPLHHCLNISRRSQLLQADLKPAGACSSLENTVFYVKNLKKQACRNYFWFPKSYLSFWAGIQKKRCANSSPNGIGICIMKQWKATQLGSSYKL